VICAIHQPHYLPWLRYLDKIARADVFVLLDDVQYSKNGWQNRNRLKGPQGAYLVTVPVRHRLTRTLTEVEIDGERWRHSHLASLRSSYGRAPGFAAFAAPIAEILSHPWRSLVELDAVMLRLWLDLLAIPTPVLRSSALRVPGEASERLANLCRAVGADHYLSGAYAAAAYLEPAVLERAGVGVLYHHWQAPVYRQPHPRAGFVPDLSIADLIAAEGTDARSLLDAAGEVSAQVTETRVS
jgi:hypothetical protein